MGGRTGRKGRVDGRKAEEGRRGCRRIARDISELAYSWEDRLEREEVGFWKRRTIAMFDIRIVNLDAGSYLSMTPEKALAKA